MSQVLRKIRVLVADDENIFRHGLARLLGMAEDVEIVGEAADGDEAVALAISRQADVVLMDIDLPQLDGIAATSMLTEWARDIKVVILAIDSDGDRLSLAMEAGARRYLTKDTGPEEILRVIRDVHEG